MEKMGSGILDPGSWIWEWDVYPGSGMFIPDPLILALKFLTMPL
jgi:hypothetical protein